MKIIGVRDWAQVVGVLFVLSGGVGVYAALRRPAPPKPPPAPTPCHDQVEIRTRGQLTFTCDWSEAVMQVYPAGDDAVLVKCVCPRAK